MGLTLPPWSRVLSVSPARKCRLMPVLLLALFLSTILFFSLFIETRDSFAGSVSSPRQHGSTNDEKPHPGLIPRKIWQISLKEQLGKVAGSTSQNEIKDALSWLALNPDYEFTLVGDEGGHEVAEKYRSSNHSLLGAYDNIPNVGMKSDLLRYMILEDQGGVYTDTDTVALKAIEHWVPLKLRDKVRLVAGIEYDRRDDAKQWPGTHHHVSLCQWTIAAAPGHPVFRSMISHALGAFDELVDTYQVPLAEIKPTDDEVLMTTGPAAWTAVVFKHLQEYDPTLNSTKDLSFMSEPTLFGDVLILPIDGFGINQKHSHSTNDGSIPPDALVKHQFHGSWRKGFWKSFWEFLGMA
ncbi:glycosyltransferase family 32 protein [Plectosphaerella plurivora]|uniref:Glycosyltransferase family 32 protein n=1 Tax=Plectosphaerella plurivora TaxID=936078 RepID=A0A9P8VC08_9PEZI|nr:glycosyltransferase family 32 protein [Plectosphaerella plurivora]